MRKFFAAALIAGSMLAAGATFAQDRIGVATFGNGKIPGAQRVILLGTSGKTEFCQIGAGRTVVMNSSSNSGCELSVIGNPGTGETCKAGARIVVTSAVCAASAEFK